MQTNPGEYSWSKLNELFQGAAEITGRGEKFSSAHATCSVCFFPLAESQPEEASAAKIWSFIREQAINLNE